MRRFIVMGGRHNWNAGVLSGLFVGLWERRIQLKRYRRGYKHVPGAEGTYYVGG